jgi:OPA family sugar phosphate sensor protein UhpC-like MFS transporter
MTLDSVLSPEFKRWRYRVFGATWLSYACYYFCRKPFYIVKSTLGEQLGWDADMLALVGAAYLIAYTVGQFLSAWAGDRWGPRILVLSGMVVSALCNASFGITNSFATFTVFMVVNGLAQSTGWCGNVAAMAPWFKRQERGTVMGFWATNFQVGGVIANTAASFILVSMGIKWAFFGGSVVLLVAWAVFLLIQRNEPRDVGLPDIEAEDEDPTSNENDKKSGWSRQVWTNVLLVGVFYFFVKFIRYALWSWSPYLLDRYYGLEADEAGYLSTVFDLCGIGGVVALGILSDRYFKGRRSTVSLYFILMMTVSCGILYTLGGTSITLYGVAIGLIGFSLYGPDAIMTSAGAIEVGSVKSAAKAAGIINGLGAVGSVAQEFVVAGMLKRGGVTPVFFTLVVSSLLAAAMLMVIIKRNKAGKADL